MNAISGKSGKGVSPVFVIAAVIVILLVAAVSVARCTSLHPDDAAVPESEQSSEEIGTDAGDDDEDTQTANSLTDEQAAIYADYDDERKQLSALLAANCWTASQETTAVSFTETSFTESGGEEMPYVICSIDSDDDDTAMDERETRTATCAILLADGTYGFLELIKATDENRDLHLTVSSESFDRSTAYTRSSPATDFKLVNAGEYLSSCIGGKQDELCEQLQNWCSLNYPTASTATWEDMLVSVDYSSSVVTFSLTLNNEAETQVSVTYDASLDVFSFE